MKSNRIIWSFCVICILWVFTLIMVKNIQNLKNLPKIKKRFSAEICNKFILQNNQILDNISDTEMEFNFDYKLLLQCFNLDERRFFHLPFVSYIVSKKWVFHGFANHIYSKATELIYPENVYCGDIVYVKTDFIKDFFENYHKHIKQPYILITHQSDFSVGYPWQLRFLNDTKIIKWFGQNVIAKHPKLMPIPIGIAPPINQNFFVLQKMAKKLYPYSNRSILLYINFTPQTNINRTSVLDYFQKNFKGNKNVVFNDRHIDWKNYLSQLEKSKFVLSPPGNGIDSHRTWEALAMGAVPIVLKSELQPLYDDMPVMVVNNWTEVTEQSMTKFQRERLKLDKDRIPRRPKLWLRYWITKIMNEKNNYIKQFCRD